MKSIRRRILLMLLLAIAAIAGVVAWNKRPSACKVPIAYQDAGGIKVFVRGTELYAVRHATVGSMVAYDFERRRWIFTGFHVKDKITSVGVGKTDRFGLDGLPHDSVLNAQGTANSLFVLYVARDDNIGLAEFGFDGHLKSKHLLRAFRYSDMAAYTDGQKQPNSFAVSREGVLAMSVKLNSKPDDDLFIFNADGRLRRRLDKGYVDCFSPTGRQLVLHDFDFTYGEVDGRLWAERDRGSGDIVILDIKSGHKRIIPELHGHYGLCSVSGPGDIKWSPDGRWLLGDAQPIFAGMDYFGTVIYAADLTETAPKWRTVQHINHFNPSWFPLSKAQMSALTGCGRFAQRGINSRDQNN